MIDAIAVIEKKIQENNDKMSELKLKGENLVSIKKDLQKEAEKENKEAQ